MLKDEILITKLLHSGGLATCTVTLREVPRLARKSRNHSVHAGTFLSKSCLPSTQSTGVSCCHGLAKSWKGTAAHVLSADGDVEQHGGAARGWAQTALGRTSGRPGAAFFM